MSIRALIVDDEAPARGELRYLLAAHPEVEVVGEAATPGEALALAESLRYDVVFLDVELPGMTGIEVARLVLDRRERPAVVFVTAHERYAGGPTGSGWRSTTRRKRSSTSPAGKRVRCGSGCAFKGSGAPGPARPDPRRRDRPPRAVPAAPRRRRPRSARRPRARRARGKRPGRSCRHPRRGRVAVRAAPADAARPFPCRRRRAGAPRAPCARSLPPARASAHAPQRRGAS